MASIHTQILHQSFPKIKQGKWFTHVHSKNGRKAGASVCMCMKQRQSKRVIHIHCVSRKRLTFG